MVNVRALSALGAAVISPVAWLFLNSVPVRIERLKVVLQRPVDDFHRRLPKGFPWILQTSLATDIETSICSNRGGVTIIWAPSGAGKTTTVRRVLKSLQLTNRIRGAIVINPPDFYGMKGSYCEAGATANHQDTRHIPTEGLVEQRNMPSMWFRAALRDMFGNLVHPNEKISDVLPKFDGRPFIFVLDHIDNAPMDEDMRVFIKTLAEDSHLTKLYTVLVICSDASNARMMWEWNGHDKIVMLNELRDQSPLTYRWEKDMIEQWLIKFNVANPSGPLQLGTDSWVRLKESAIIAGTPGFLVETALAANITTVKLRDIRHIPKYCEHLANGGIWMKRATYTRGLWDMGERVLDI